MARTRLQPHTSESGYVLPSIHAFPPFFTLQPNPETRALQEQYWRRLTLAYARHRRLFTLAADDAESPTSEWREVLRNERIDRSLRANQVEQLLAALVVHSEAFYEPAKQTRIVMLLWRTIDEWAEVLYSWAISTGQLNTILTFYEIQYPELPSALSDIPTTLLRRAIDVLRKTNRAQIIESAEGGGVRLFGGS